MPHSYVIPSHLISGRTTRIASKIAAKQRDYAEGLTVRYMDRLAVDLRFMGLLDNSFVDMLSKFSHVGGYTKEARKNKKNKPKILPAKKTDEDTSEDTEGQPQGQPQEQEPFTHRERNYGKGVSEMIENMFERAIPTRKIKNEQTGKEELWNFVQMPEVQSAIQSSYDTIRKSVSAILPKQLYKRLEKDFSVYKYTVTKKGKKKEVVWSTIRFRKENIDTVIKEFASNSILGVLKNEEEDQATTPSPQSADPVSVKSSAEENVEQKQKTVKKIDEVTLAKFLNDFPYMYDITEERTTGLREGDESIRLNASVAPEHIQETIRDMITHYYADQAAFEQALIATRFREEYKGKSVEKAIPMGVVVYKPEMGGQRAELLQQRGIKVRSRTLDADVLRFFREVKNSDNPYVEWRYVTIQTETVMPQEGEGTEATDTNLLQCRIPAYPEAGKVFSIPIPGYLGSRVKDQRPGQKNTFRVLDVSTETEFQPREGGVLKFSGVKLQFTEQVDEAVKNKLETIKMHGVQPDRLQKMFQTMSSNYIYDVMFKEDLDTIIGKYKGLFVVEGTAIDSLEKLKEKMAASGEAVKRGESFETWKKKRVEEEQKEQEYAQMFPSIPGVPGSEEYAKIIPEVVIRQDQRNKRVDEIAKTIATGFSPKANFGKVPDLATAFLTSPTIYFLVSIMLDEALPITTEGKIEWRKFFEDLINSRVLEDPVLYQKYFKGREADDLLSAVYVVLSHEKGLPEDQYQAILNDYSTGKTINNAQRKEVLDFLRKPNVLLNIKQKIAPNITAEIQNIVYKLMVSNDPVISNLIQKSVSREKRPGAPYTDREPSVRTLYDEIRGTEDQMRKDLENRSMGFEEALENRDFANARRALMQVSLRKGLKENDKNTLGMLESTVYPEGDPSEEAFPMIRDLVDSFEQQGHQKIDNAIKKQTTISLKTAAQQYYFGVLNALSSGCYQQDPEVYKDIIHTIYKRKNYAS